MMMMGHEMRSGLDADLEAAGVRPAREQYPGARQLQERRAAAEQHARAVIEKAQAKQRADAARGRRPAEIAVGDKVWLANRNMRAQDSTPGARKLEALYHGPYEVVEMHGTNAAELQLPQGCLLHPVFNLDLLKKYIDGAREFPGRPARYERPGPVLEEDPEAGGPASGDPVYEVEAVIARRGRGARKQYRVLWKGWPEEQASWLGSNNWTGCEDAIAEFEAREVGVSALQAARMQRGQETERARRAAVQETRENHPRAADCPPVDKKGQIDMGSQRCTADTKAGCWCKARTKHGCYCWVHRAARDGTRIKQSATAGAGLGLFATRAFAKNAVVARYTGDLIDTELGARANGFDGSHYVLEMSEALAIDAARTNTADGRMINDARGSNKRHNVRFVCNQQNKTVTIRTTRAVRAGEEFLLSYGRGFWQQQGAAVPPQRIFAATKGSVARKEAAKEKKRAAGRSWEEPIVLASARTIRVNMMQRGAGARRGARPGEWIDDDHWLCNCHWSDARRARVVDGCTGCGMERPEEQPQRPQQQQPPQQAAPARIDWARFRDDDSPAAPAAVGAGYVAASSMVLAPSALSVSNRAAAFARQSSQSQSAPAAGAQAAAAGQWPPPAAAAPRRRAAGAQPDTPEMAARRNAWGAAQAGVSGGAVRRVDEATSARQEPQWDQTSVDCRGCASIDDAAQARHLAVRVPQRKLGYCRRNTCECCAPHAPWVGAGAGQWCSCLAVDDGLCRRCWMDYYGGPATWKSQYWGPQ